MIEPRLGHRQPASWLFGWLLLASLAGGGCGDEDAEPEAGGDELIDELIGVRYVDITAEAGIDFSHVNGASGRYYYVETYGSGAAFLDFDADGHQDLYVVNSGPLPGFAVEGEPTTNVLYRNDGTGSFQDVTAAAGVGDRSYGMGTCAGDIDNDGYVDLYVTNFGANVLYRNHGNGTFTDVTDDAGVGDERVGSSAAFADWDRDGDLDLYVANYAKFSVDTDQACFQGDIQVYCDPEQYEGDSGVFYRNDGTGGFADVTREVGGYTEAGRQLGVVFSDYDDDGDADLYVANDGMANQLWINRGGLKFVDEGLSSGTAFNAVGEAEAGMGIAATDVDSDGDLDLFVSHLREETNTFYLRDTDRFFEDITNRTGLGSTSYEFTGFGLGIIDFDHDGLLDIYVANGRINYWDPVNDPEDIYAESNQLFRGVGALKFEEVAPRGGTASPIVETSRAAAFGDLDNDGAVDIVVGNRDAKATVLRNTVGSLGHWVQLAIRDSEARYALHARVRIDAGGVSRWRRVQRAYSYCGSNDPRVHCGLGSATTVDKVTVYWEDGTTTEFGPLDIDRVHVLQRN